MARVFHLLLCGKNAAFKRRHVSVHLCQINGAIDHRNTAGGKQVSPLLLLSLLLFSSSSSFLPLQGLAH